jgi:hypothetical protein
MAGKIARCKLGHLSITAVFRHQWDDDNDLYNKFKYKTKTLGLWWKKDEAVGTTKKGKEAFSKSNMMPSFTIGLNLIWATCWLNIDWKVLKLKIND